MTSRVLYITLDSLTSAMHFIVIGQKNTGHGKTSARTPSSTLGSLYNFRQLVKFANHSAPPTCVISAAYDLAPRLHVEQCVSAGQG